MADDNTGKDKKAGSGGRSLGGGAAEPLPAGWGASSGSAARVGRVGQWGARCDHSLLARVVPAF